MLTIIAKLALLGAVTSPSVSDPPPGRHHSWFGLDVCVGAPTDVRECDVTIHKPVERAPTVTTTKEGANLPLEIRLFGKSLCVGAVPPGVHCDLRFTETNGNPQPA